MLSNRQTDTRRLTHTSQNYLIYKNSKNNTYTFFKRGFDIFFSLFAILLFSPIFIIIAVLIKVNSPKGKVIFTQKRLGKNGKLFKVYKFTTMIPNAETILEEWLEIHPDIKKEYLEYRKLKYDPRIIKGIGNFLRKSSLDELPQFFNVLMGDMSIVGPRPYIKEEFCNHSQKKIDLILSVKPGITGFWQVTERSNSTFNSRVETDIIYVKKHTTRLDIKIIFDTIGVMLFRKGAY